MMAPMRLSVVLCTYNGARYLEQQLASIASQTRLPDEMIICDDRSSDGTVDILKNFALGARFPVQLYLNERNLGSTGNFEKAIGLSSGDIIFPCDQDDYWHPQKLECIEQIFLAAPGVGLVFSDAEVMDEHFNPLRYCLWHSIGFDASEQALVKSGGGTGSAAEAQRCDGDRYGLQSVLPGADPAYPFELGT